MTDAALPIDAVLPELLDTLRTHPRVILQAEPGAGKTTRVPLAVLESGLVEGTILMLEPRRVAARNAATFMAAQLGEPVGETVGYRIRFESRTSARTRIEVLTQGLLTRRLQDDPELAGVGMIIFDEFHERQLASDLGLALALDVQEGLRDDLKLLVMSATLELQSLGAFLDAPVVESEGRGYPVTVEHVAGGRDERTEQLVVRTVRQASTKHPGDILVFLPGTGLIRRLQQSLSDLHTVALHGDLPVDAQSAVLNPPEETPQRVILATNVAESSVTIPRVRTVIDTGLANEPRFEPTTGLSALRTVPISQASATQRSGRAGRTAPGQAYRLWPSSQRLEPQRRAEITQVDLSSLALELAAWGSTDLRFLDPPSQPMLAAAREQLRGLGFLDAHDHLTDDGRRALQLGLPPRQARLVLNADRHADIASVLALLESRTARHSDDLVRRYREWLANPKSRDWAAATRLREQWQRRLPSRGAPNPDNLALTLAEGYLDRVAHRSDRDPLRYQLFNGQTAVLHPETDLRGHEWLVVAELEHDRPHARIRAAAPITESILRERFADHWRRETPAEFDPRTEAMHAYQVERFGRIETGRKSAGAADPEQAAQALVRYVQAQGMASLPLADRTQEWLTRVRCARHWLPERTADWPSMDSAALLADPGWLLPVVRGKSRLRNIDPEAIDNALRNLLPWDARRQLDEWCPRRITVPSGMERGIEYAFDEQWRNAEGETVTHAHPPVLAVKLQELFGLKETPRIADGRIPLTLHLLSPGGKPLQVTTDLRSFWSQTYPEVRREMKGRYPRHPWPDDPDSFEPTHKTTRRLQESRKS